MIDIKTLSEKIKLYGINNINLGYFIFNENNNRYEWQPDLSQFYLYPQESIEVILFKLKEINKETTS